MNAKKLDEQNAKELHLLDLPLDVLISIGRFASTNPADLNSHVGFVEFLTQKDNNWWQPGPVEWPERYEPFRKMYCNCERNAEGKWVEGKWPK